jgi:hypothetical protein
MQNLLNKIAEYRHSIEVVRDAALNKACQDQDDDSAVECDLRDAQLDTIDTILAWLKEPLRVWVVTGVSTDGNTDELATFFDAKEARKFARDWENPIEDMFHNEDPFEDDLGGTYGDLSVLEVMINQQTVESPVTGEPISENTFNNIYAIPTNEQ